MATIQAMRPTPNIRVRNTLSYGILMTTESWLLGYARFGKRGYVEFLTTHVIGDRLPQELIDIVQSHLLSLEMCDAKQRWKGQIGIQKRRRERKFQPSFDDRIDAFEQSISKIQCSKVNLIHPQGVYSDDGAPDLVHLSMEADRLSFRMSDATDESDSGAEFPYQKAMYKSQNGSAAAHCVVEAGIKYFPNQNAPPVTLPVPVACRMIECVSVEEAIAGWDSALIQSLVDELQLQVVSPCKGEALKPRLRMHQIVEEIA